MGLLRPLVVLAIAGVSMGVPGVARCDQPSDESLIGTITDQLATLPPGDLRPLKGRCGLLAGADRPAPDRTGGPPGPEHRDVGAVGNAQGHA